MTTLAGPHVLVRNPTIATTTAHTDLVPTIVLARSDDDAWLTWRPEAEAHLLIGARAGAGGTAALRTAVLTWTAAGGVAHLIDPYYRRLEGLRNWPNVHAVAGQGDEHAAMSIVEELHVEMQRRHRDLENGTARLNDFVPLLLAIDDHPDFDGWCERAPEATTTDSPGTGGPPAIRARSFVPRKAVEDLLRRGRCARIHLAVRTTRASSVGIPLLNHFSQRMWIGPANYQESYTMWSSILGAEISSHVRGRAVCSDLSGQPVKAQAVWTPDPTSAHLTRDDQLQLQALRPLVQRC